MFRSEVGRKTRSASVLSVWVALVFLFAVPASAAPNTWKDEKDGFSFDYPETWVPVDESMLGNMSVAVYTKPVDNFATNFNVVVTRPQGVPSATEAELAEVYRSVMTDLEMMSFKKDSFRGEVCIITEYRWTQGTHRVQQRQYLVDHGDKGYSLTFTALRSNFGDYEGAFETILNSFEF